MKPFAIVLHGPTSAGKSTTATALQDCAPVPAFHSRCLNGEHCTNLVEPLLSPGIGDMADGR